MWIAEHQWEMIIYGSPIIAAIFVAIAILRTKEPPNSAYLVFGALVSFFMLFVLIDSGRIHDLPGIKAGASEYALIQRT
ncbi:MAG: hypothetical protein KDA57_23855, partial [Planctomycetales bacterium]|nr:hypothetical protein [Planctomycetales bacterium]